MQTNRCINCKNYVGNLACFAFPEGIPDVILIGGNMHTKPLKKQTIPIVFEPKD